MPAPPSHPWLPSGQELGPPSQQGLVKELIARAPTDLKPKVMQIRHDAMKGDMDAQMQRLARGLEAERELISHFKAVAFERAISADVSTSALPLASDPMDSIRGVRQQANEMREEALVELARVAEEEHAKLLAAAPPTAAHKFRGTMGRSMLKLGAVSMLEAAMLRRKSHVHDPSRRRGSVNRRASRADVGGVSFAQHEN